MSYYECLGIDKNATENEIKKAYYKYAKLYHPDKSNDKESEEKFKLCCEAYEVLSNPEKRKLYDRYGKKGLQNNVIMKKTPNIDIVLELTLSELYTGTKKNVSYQRQVSCIKCDGKGTLKPIDTTCKQCHGQGQAVKMQRHGNMMFQNVVPCSTCLGKGYKINDSDKCKDCHGDRCSEETKTLTVEIEKGMPECVLIFYGESHLITDMIAGDVRITIKTLSDVYERKDNDLIMIKNISFLQSITGKISLNHFGKILNIDGGLIQPESIKKLTNHGMPLFRSDKYGDLYLVFHVIYDFTPEQITQFKTILNDDIVQDGFISVKDGFISLIHVDQLPRHAEPEQQQCVQQ